VAQRYALSVSDLGGHPTLNTIMYLLVNFKARNLIFFLLCV
jgi:hypothetical protein